MTTRTAELLMALIMAAFSAYLMWKSTELNFGWVEDEGPGGGAWPFWLASVMFASCLWTLANWVRRASTVSRDTTAFFPAGVFKSVAAVALALIVTVGLFNGVAVDVPGIGSFKTPALGAYVALTAFMVFYVGFLGRHGVVTTLLAATLTPVLTFLFFEVALKIILPKGITEPVFLPLFRFFGMGGL
ncbi:MAG: tripartite tricarboxylate transporter TctB family protein [Pseudomonadota bacterium]